MSGRPPKTAPSRPQVILPVAATAFVRDGYGATSLDTIAREAGVSKATLYRYFQDKEALFKAVVEARAKELFQGFETAPLAGEPEEALARFARVMLDALLAPMSMGLFRLVISESGRVPQVGEFFLGAVVPVSCDVIKRYLKDQNESGRLAIADPLLASMHFLGMLKEVAFWPRLIGGPGAGAPEDAIPAAVDAFLRAYSASGLKDPRAKKALRAKARKAKR